MKQHFCQVFCARFDRVEDRCFRTAQGSSPACCNSLALTAHNSKATKRKVVLFANMLTEMHDEAWRVMLAWLICTIGEEAGLQSCLCFSDSIHR